MKRLDRTPQLEAAGPALYGLAAACLAAVLGFTGHAWASPAGQIDPGVLSEIVLFPTLFGTVAFLVWVLAQHRRRQAELRLQHELRLKVLEHLGAAPDLASLLASEKGSLLMQDLAGGGRLALSHRIIGAVMWGAVLMAVGTGLWLIALTTDLGIKAPFVAFSILLLALGCGLLLAAFAAWWLGRFLGDADRPREWTPKPPDDGEGAADA